MIHTSVSSGLSVTQLPSNRRRRHCRRFYVLVVWHDCSHHISYCLLALCSMIIYVNVNFVIDLLPTGYDVSINVPSFCRSIVSKPGYKSSQAPNTRLVMYYTVPGLSPEGYSGSIKLAQNNLNIKYLSRIKIVFRVMPYFKACSVESAARLFLSFQRMYMLCLNSRHSWRNNIHFWFYCSGLGTVTMYWEGEKGRVQLWFVLIQNITKLVCCHYMY